MSLKRLVTKGIRNPRSAATAVIHELLAPFGHSRFRRFIVLSRSRTGSNLLISLLSKHPGVQVKGEIFSRLKGRPHTKVLARVFRRQPFYVKAAGFKIFYYHPQDDDSGRIWETLASMEDLHVIHLKRRNILRTLISRRLAGIQGDWVATSQEPRRAAGEKPTSVTFSPAELGKGFAETRGWEQAGDDRFRNHPLLTVYYEDLVRHSEESFHQVTDFLGVRYHRAETELRKQNTRSLRDSVTNYDELKLAFTGMTWQQFFED